MIKLSDIDTHAPKNLSKHSIKAEVKVLAKKIGELQQVMYAQKKHSLLVVLQGMDASGKDGATKHVFQDCNPSGIDAYSFKKPTELEFAHDFLWRCHARAPQKGNIMVFVRSHYEDILIQKVHNWIDSDRRAKRMAAINSFEELLEFDNNTTVLKFYLHISPERQLEKLQERIDRPEKNWKHNPADWEERKLWPEYMKAYEYAINQSSIPWNIVPADQRWYRNYFVAKKVLETLQSMNLQLPHIEDLSKGNG
ncbi:MAG: polyphosphate kinase [Saprospiraceae bacterium]|nr:polyphosphate kinase [Saprospiraceae bacterium]